MKRSNRKPLLLAALLASSPALDFTESDGLSVRANFPDKARVNDAGHLLTQEDFRVELERVEFDAHSIDLQARNEEDLERILTIPNFGPDQTELVIRGAKVHGRIFDNRGDGRVPDAGLGISGQLPVEVVVQRGSDSATPLQVRFEVPTFFFEGVDWSKPV